MELALGAEGSGKTRVLSPPWSWYTTPSTRTTPDWGSLTLQEEVRLSVELKKSRSRGNISPSTRYASCGGVMSMTRVFDVAVAASPAPFEARTVTTTVSPLRKVSWFHVVFRTLPATESIESMPGEGSVRCTVMT